MKSRCMPSLAAILFLSGCWPAPSLMDAPSNGSAQATSRIVRGEIRRVFQDKKFTPLTVTGRDLERLRAFFPGAGTGLSNEFAGGWIAGYKVRLYRQEGSAIDISTDLSAQFWSEGHGDWQLEKGFVPFVDNLDVSHSK